MSEHASTTSRGDGYRHYWAIALLLVALAVLLRWINLAGWDMWTDEVQTLWQAQSGNYHEGPMYSTAPINFWLTRISVEAFGANELGERFPSFATGVLAVAVFAWGFRRWIGARAALLGAFLLAIDPWHVGWSQTGRHFSPQMLFVLIGVLLFLKGWTDRRPVAVWVSAAFLAAAIFTHSSTTFFAGTLLVALAAEWWSSRRSESRRGAGDYLKAGLPIALVLLVYLPIFVGVGSYLLENKPPWNPGWNILGSLAFYIMPPLACSALAGIFIGWKEKQDWRLLFPLLVTVPLLLLVISTSFTIASAAYLLSMLPFVVALASFALVRVVDWASDRELLWAGLAIVAGVVLARGYELAHYYTVYNGFKARWEEVTRYVEDRRQSGESFYASTGDVVEFYAGRGSAQWINDVTLARAPEAGAWYAVYSAGVPFRHDVSPRYRQISEFAELRAIFPVQYGAKDRTIAVFQTPRAIDGTSE